MPLFFFTVEQQERAIVERFGKFVRVAGPGLQTKTPFVERVAGRMSLQVEQLNSEIETKTKDNVFVRVKLAVQYKVGPSDQQVQDAYYKLDGSQHEQQGDRDVPAAGGRMQQPDHQWADAGNQVADRLRERGQRGGDARIGGSRHHEEDGQAET